MEMDEDEDDFEDIYADELLVLRELEEKSPTNRPFGERTAKRARVEEAEREDGSKKLKVDVVATKLPTCPPVEATRCGQRKRVWKRIPPGNFIPVTCPETKRRVYLSIRSENSIQPRFAAGVMQELVSTPFAILRCQAEALRQRSQTRECIVNEEKMATELWVDQFRPKDYIDLLSDDGINRNLLRWLKLWDKVVFDRQSRAVREKKSQTAVKKKFAKQVVEELDPSGCPAQRVALLCGPPGLGKTTLAHVIANHAGYNVVELNASDDRSPELFRRQIEASTQMRSVLDPRPNCLVIDEIDGAPAASINLLLSMTTAKESKVKDKRKNSANGLRRPIVCICNDQYVPALRQLRQSALVLSFPSIAATRLAFRLQDILNLQKYALDLSTLLALCKKSENDVRSCLGTLQFVFGRSKTKLVTLSSILSSAVGVKDAQKTHFSLWRDIFHSKDGKRRNEDEESSESSFHRLVRDAQTNGDYDKMYQGVFHNYLATRSNRLDGFCQVMGWFEFVDLIQLRTYETQSFVLLSYLPLASAYFRSQLASNSQPKLEYPTAQAEVRNRTLACQNVLETLNQDRAPRVRSLNGRRALLLDVLPYLSVILRPPLRPVNSRLLSARERDELKSLVDLMVSLNLSLVQKKSAEGQYSFEMEPNVDELVRFPASNLQNQRHDLTYAAKQLVSREIELEKVRRGEKKMDDKEAATKPVTGVVPVAAVAAVDAADKRRNLVERVGHSVDFFGRSLPAAVRSFSPLKHEADASSSVFSRSDIWFRFKEGYSNAVRRNVRISDLL